MTNSARSVVTKLPNRHHSPGGNPHQPIAAAVKSPPADDALGMQTRVHETILVNHKITGTSRGG